MEKFCGTGGGFCSKCGGEPVHEDRFATGAGLAVIRRECLECRYVSYENAVEKKPPEKGLLVYDLPVRLGSLLRQKLYGAVLHVNNSVKVGRWEDKALVEGIVSEVVEQAKPEEKERIDVRFLGQHEISDADLTDMAKKAAVRQMQDLNKSLTDRIAKIPELVQKALEAKKIDVNEVSQRKAQKIRAVIRDVQKRSEALGRIAVFLSIEDSLKGWHQMVKDLLAAEQAGLERLKTEIKVAKKAVPAPPPAAPALPETAEQSA